ncbi:NACHT domain-containing protein [Actinomadura sp. NPDC049753]|uniref:NACHT domain-containing protein n=1 Tax=Actinomadura sp. NPDC049753 TaxID=3154739 RepID=UPI00341E49DE
MAVNQVYNNGKLSWSWGYLALVFTLLGALVQAAPPPVAPSQETVSSPPPARGRRKGSRRRYLRRMRSAVEQMETIGLVTQAAYVLRTRQVYVDVMLRPRPVTDTVTDTGIGSVSSTEAGRRASLASFLTPGRVLAVLGAAGSGKTTLARYTALEMAERREPGRRRHGPLPVLLYLRDHAEAIAGGEPEGLAQVAATAPWLDGAVSAEWLDERLRRGRCVVLLDGLDEVAESGDRSRVVRWVEDQISRYPANAFVVTSRPLGYDANRLSRADVLQVQRFTNQQIRDFLHAWYRAIERRARRGDPEEIDRIAAQAADDLFRRISGRPVLADLAANPLLLTMIANVHRYRGSLPGSRVALYEEVCQVLLHRRQEAKRLADGEVDGLSGDKKERIVQELAWYMMRRELRDIPAEEAERAVHAVMARTAPNVTPAAFLLHVKRSGLLLEHQHGRYGFAHLTLQEYLASMRVPAHASRRELLMDNVSNPWWREVTLLWAARADASPLVEACLADRTVPALNLAYACAEEARELDPALRTRLDRLLRSESREPEEIRLLDGVAAARVLQDTHVLEDGTRICAHPVPDDLWRRFVVHTEDRHAPDNASGDLWTKDIKAFLAWLNGLFGDGTGYRLPTPAEARQALDRDLYPATTGGAETVLYAADQDWTHTHGQTRLIPYTPDRAPHWPTPQQIDAYPALIIEQTHVLFRLLTPATPAVFPHLLAFAQPRDPNRAEDRLLEALDLAFDLSFASERVIDAAHGRLSERAVDLGFDALPDHADQRAIAGLRDRAIVHATALGQELGRDLASGRRWLSYDNGTVSAALVGALFEAIHQRSRDFVRDHPLAGLLPLGGRSIHEFDPALALGRPDQTLMNDLDRAMNEARELADALIRSPASSRAHGIAVEIIGSIDRLRIEGPAGGGPLVPIGNSTMVGGNASRNTSIDHVLRIVRAVHPLTRSAASIRSSDTDSALAWHLADELRQALIRVRDHAFCLAEYKNGDPGLYAPDFSATGLVQDLILARLIFAGELGTKGMDVVVSTVRACLSLRNSFVATRPRRTGGSPRRGSRATTMASFIRDELRHFSANSPARDPEVDLKAALQRADTIKFKEATVLIDNAIRLAAPLWERSRPRKRSSMVLAVTSLLGALHLTERERLDQELARHLTWALNSLIALTPDSHIPAFDEPPSGKLLVLARA